MSEDELPEGWATTTLAEAVDQNAPIQYGILQPGPDTPGGIPYVRPTEIRGDEIDVADLRRTTPAIATKYVRSSLRAGDVILTIVGSIGKVAVVPPALNGANITQSSARLRPRHGLITTGYLAWFVRSPVACRQFDEVELGTGVPRLNIGDIRKVEIPLPPFFEQRRIVEKVEALLAQVNAAPARLAKVPTILKRFRQSILSAACAGRLTEHWRTTRVPMETGAMIADRLKHLHEPAGTGRRGNAAEPSDEAHDFDGSDLPETWTVCELLWMCAPSRPITYGILKPGPDQEDGVLYIRVADFPGNRLKLADIRRTSRTIADAYKRSTLRTGDLLLSIRGTFGRVCRVPRELDGANITQDTARLSIHESVDPEYILAWLKSPSLQDRLGRSAKGAAVRGVNIGDVRALQVALPPLEEQHEIVRRVDALFKLADAIEARVAAATARADKITQAILVKAFRGELVLTEAELARKEGRDYEPASALLARIRAARADNDEKPTRRPRAAAATPAPATMKRGRRRTSDRTG